MGTNKRSSELEFQGMVVSWINQELSRRPGLGIELSSQETSKLDRKRNDVVIWRKRAADNAFMTMELKTPETPITDLDLLKDACKKARKWNSKYFAIWNMKELELYKTPSVNQEINPDFRIWSSSLTGIIQSVDDWLDEKKRLKLKNKSIELLNKTWDIDSHKKQKFKIDASLFVDRLSNRIQELKSTIYPDLRDKALSNSKLRLKLREIAATQGFLGFVEDINQSIVGQYCYRVVGQILFYFALSRHLPNLGELEIDDSIPFKESLQNFWNDVRRYDYEALFAPSEYDEIIPLNNQAEKQLKNLIQDFNKYDWNSLNDDVLGAIFEKLIPHDEQVLLGQFYTPSVVADLLLSFAVDDEEPKLLDPGCGTGTFLLRAYKLLDETRNLDHKKLMSLLWGFDLSPFATELAVINLYRQNLSEYINFPRILSGDFFSRTVGEKVEFPPPKKGMQAKVKVSIPQFDAVVANPPYIRSQHQDDLDEEYKNKLYSIMAKEHGLSAPPKTDLFAFFVYHSYPFLKNSGKISFVTSSSWLVADYGTLLKKFLLKKFKNIIIIGSDVESFFTQVEQNTVLFIAEKRNPENEINKDEKIKFVSLKKEIKKFIKSKDSRWDDILRLTDKITVLERNYENEELRLREQNVQNELQKIENKKSKSVNWSVYLRAPKAFFDILDKSSSSIVELQNIAECHLGYKSLQNKFFYLDKETIEYYDIEDEYLKPIYKLGHLDNESFIQKNNNVISIFYCKEEENDLRGTGALSYIRNMENKPAKKKKQSSDENTIRNALEKQSGKVWYHPKAIPHEANIWLRKAFDGIYAPFIFKSSRILDQRGNYLVPLKNLKWKEVASLLTSSIFALSAEAYGATSLGAGALELPTTKLRKILVPDISEFSKSQRAKMVDYAVSVWENKTPLNWKSSNLNISKELKKLDSHILKCMNIDFPVEDLHASIKQTLDNRIRLGNLKSKAQKETTKANLKLVAESVVSNLDDRINSFRFPENFIETDREEIHLENNIDLIVKLKPFLGQSDLTVETLEGDRLIDKTLPAYKAEVILRALLLGRKSFSIPVNENEAEEVIKKFWEWVEPIYKDLKRECASTTVGSSYENEIFNKALAIIGWSGDLTKPATTEQFYIST